MTTEHTYPTAPPAIDRLSQAVETTRRTLRRRTPELAWLAALRAAGLVEEVRGELGRAAEALEAEHARAVALELRLARAEEVIGQLRTAHTAEHLSLGTEPWRPRGGQ